MVILIWTFAFCLCSSVPLTMYTSLSDFRITFAPVWLLILLRLLPSLPMTKPLYPSGISTSSPAKDCSWILFFIFSCRRKTGRHAKSAFPLRYTWRDTYTQKTSLEMKIALSSNTYTWEASARTCRKLIHELGLYFYFSRKCMSWILSLPQEKLI